MSSNNFDKKESIHQEILTSDPIAKQEDDTQNDFKQNNKKLMLSSNRMSIDKTENENMKLPQKTQDNMEEVDVVVPTNPENDLARDEKVLQAEQNEYYVFLNRFLYSKKCVVVYCFIIILDLCGLGNLVAFYISKKISKYLHLY